MTHKPCQKLIIFRPNIWEDLLRLSNWTSFSKHTGRRVSCGTVSSWNLFALVTVILWSCPAPWWAIIEEWVRSHDFQSGVRGGGKTRLAAEHWRAICCTSVCLCSRPRKNLRDKQEMHISPDCSFVKLVQVLLWCRDQQKRQLFSLNTHWPGEFLSQLISVSTITGVF